MDDPTVEPIPDVRNDPVPEGPYPEPADDAEDPGEDPGDVQHEPVVEP